jgi:hypothetical protein
MKTAVRLLTINLAMVIAQVSPECLSTSVESYGSKTGSYFSSLNELRSIDFDQTMVLSSITACIGEKNEIFSLKLQTKSTESGQVFTMPLIGVINGYCNSVSIMKEGDFVKTLSIYTTTMLAGLEIVTD